MALNLARPSDRLSDDAESRVVSVPLGTIARMDLLDGEPYLGLLPRWVGKVVAWAVVLSMAFVPPARQWIVGQATHHVMHQIEGIPGAKCWVLRAPDLGSSEHLESSATS